MSLSNIEQLSMETETDEDEVAVTDDSLSSENTSEDDNEDKSVVSSAIATIEDYLRYNAPVFERLQSLRAKVSAIVSDLLCSGPSTTGKRC